jgi:hypothetical protein
MVYGMDIWQFCPGYSSLQICLKYLSSRVLDYILKLASRRIRKTLITTQTAQCTAIAEVSDSDLPINHIRRPRARHLQGAERGRYMASAPIVLKRLA